jgi:putative nucleotidyltransferase with HDIG domain
MTPAPTPSRWLGRYAGAVTIAGLGVIGYSLSQLPTTPQPTGWLALGALALVMARFALKLPGVAAHVSISDTFLFTSALLFGPAPATVTIALDSLLMSWRRRHNRLQLLFNPTSNALSLWCGAWVYTGLAAMGGATAEPGQDGAGMLLPLAGMTAVYFLLNSGLTSVAIALTRRVPTFQLWREHFLPISVNFLAAASASFSLVVVLHHAGLVAAAAVLPLIFVFYITMRACVGRLDDARSHIDKVNKLYLSTVGAFATAIEAKDGVTSDHIQRVRRYALELARALDVTDEPTLLALEAAALLHDTGKLAIPDHILNKPGRLTAYEYETMKLHADAGADILSSIDFPYPVVPMVRGHHENWDGSGYPAGLRGDAIPLGARILSVVDCYDALTSDRPYRSAMTDSEAMLLILERRGTMYDPVIVDAFVRIDRSVGRSEDQQPVVTPALQRLGDVARNGAGAAHTAALTGGGPTAGIPEELLAFVSLAHVASHRASPADVARLTWGPLQQVVPNASVALYTIDEETHTLSASFAAGSGAGALTALRFGIGERISGWVAANQRPMINADGDRDLAGPAPASLRYAVALPLIAGGRPVGVVTIYGAEQFRDDQVRRLELIVPHLAEAIAAVEVREPALARVAGASVSSRNGARFRVYSPSRLRIIER